MAGWTVTRLRPDTMLLACALALGAGLAAVVARRPTVGALAIIGVLPFQIQIFSFLLHIGLPSAIVHGLGFWKEAVIAGLVLGALKHTGTHQPSLDTLDRIVIAYIAVVTVYLLIPQLLTPSAPQSIFERLVAYRSDVAFGFVFLALRHGPIERDAARRLARVTIVSALVVAMVGVYEWFFSDAWNSFSVDVLEVARYKATILNVVVPNPNDLRIYGNIGGRTTVRVGSVFYSQGVGLYLLAAFAFVIAGVVSRRVTPLLAFTGVAVTLTTFFAQTRAPLVGGIVVVFVAANRRGARYASGRARLVFVMMLVVALALPLAETSGVSDRVTSGDTTADHLASTTTGLAAIVADPVGTGLGTAPEGARFNAGGIAAENSYLQVGNEIGLVAMVIFVAIFIVLFRELNLVARGGGMGGDVAFALRCGGIGLFVAGLFLHVWQFEQALIMFTAFGLALNPAFNRAAGQRDPKGFAFTE